MNTFEMDGLFTKEDINNRFFIMGQCTKCGEWSKWDTRVGEWKCSYCPNEHYKRRESCSIRSWAPKKKLTFKA